MKINIIVIILEILFILYFLFAEHIAERLKERKKSNKLKVSLEKDNEVWAYHKEYALTVSDNGCCIWSLKDQIELYAIKNIHPFLPITAGIIKDKIQILAEKDGDIYMYKLNNLPELLNSEPELI
jgi:transcriptional regulator